MHCVVITMRKHHILLWQHTKCSLVNKAH